jgi:hypothetical protein
MRDFLENRPVVATSAQSGKKKPEGSSSLPRSNKIDAPPSHEFPKLDLKHDAHGRIQEIVILCQCGERTVLQCHY